MDDTATAAAANGPPAEMTTAPPSQQRGQKRARGAQEDDAAAAFVETTEASWFIQVHEVGQDDEEAQFASQLIDFLGIHLMNDGDDDEKAAGSDQYPSAADGLAAAAGGDDNDASADFAGGGAPTSNLSSGGPPFGFDLNQLLSPEDESAGVDGGSAAAAAVEFTAPDEAAVRRPSSGGFDFDLNEPCPSELFPDDAPDPSDVPEPDPPAPAEDSPARPDADERPELPADGGAPVSRSRRRHLRLWDWAFYWTSGLGLGPLGWKRSCRR